MALSITSRWPNGKIFKKFLRRGWKIFPTSFLANFDVFLVDFDAKTQNGEGKKGLG